MSEQDDKQQPVHLSEIGQIALTVSDLARAKAFYKDILGMSLLYDAGTMVFFQCGATRLMIGLPEAGAPEVPENRSGTILYFKVPDIQATVETLRSASVVFTQEPHSVAKTPTYELWMAFFKDPDENQLALMNEQTHDPAK